MAVDHERTDKGDETYNGSRIVLTVLERIDVRLGPSCPEFVRQTRRHISMQHIVLPGRETVITLAVAAPCEPGNNIRSGYRVCKKEWIHVHWIQVY